MYSFDEITPTTASEERKPAFHALTGILTFILLPHVWCLSIPALIFSAEAKKLYKKGNGDLALYFASKAKKFIISSWLVTLILALAAFIMLAVIRLSII